VKWRETETGESERVPSLYREKTENKETARMKMMMNEQETPGNGQELLTLDELAIFLKVPKGWIYARTRERAPDTLPFYKVGKYLRFRLNEVQQWLESRHRGWQPE
jgi:excisionase family DNA binding protein